MRFRLLVKKEQPLLAYAIASLVIFGITTAAAGVLASEPETTSTESPLTWRAGADLGLAKPSGSMADDLESGKVVNVFVAKEVQLLPSWKTLASLNLGLVNFSGEKSNQKNEATDTNLSLMLSTFHPVAEDWLLTAGIGAGISRWTASASGPGLSLDNQGMDPSLDLLFGAEYRLQPSVSLLINARYRKTFDKFNVTYIPLTVGLSYDFGEQQ